jgi:hypothetical protein
MKYVRVINMQILKMYVQLGGFSDVNVLMSNT